MSTQYLIPNSNAAFVFSDEPNGAVKGTEFTANDPADEIMILKIKTALVNLYQNSATARAILDQSTSGSLVTIYKHIDPNDAQGFGSGAVSIGANVFGGTGGNSDVQYVGADGKLHLVTQTDLIMHEMIHAILGTGDFLVSDGGNGDSVHYSEPWYSFPGRTQNIENQIMAEMRGGSPDAMRVGYLATRGVETGMAA
jgi:hypothetical protein